MTHLDPSPDAPLRALVRLRRADVVTGAVLAILAAAMILEALTFPLEGTYAGVQNAWYVSPALFPLIVGAMLLILSLGLLGKAVGDIRRLAPGGSLLALGELTITGRALDAVLIGLLLGAYIVGLVPRADFMIATAFFLVVFMGVYAMASRPGRILLATSFVVSAAVALAVALAGSWPAPRSAGQSVADGALAVVLLFAVAVLVALARGAERRRLLPVLATAFGAALILSAVFKYVLLVPLPREGAAVLFMDAAINGLPGLGR